MSKLFDAPVEERTLQNYHREARAMIRRWGSAWMISDEDVITNVANAIARAEMDFDPSRGCKRVTLRCTYGRRQIWAEIKKRITVNKRPTHHSLNIDDDNGRTAFHVPDTKIGSAVDEVIKKEMQERTFAQIRKHLDRRRKSALTRNQKDCLRMRYLDGMSLKAIASKRGCSKQAVSELLKFGIEKLRGELKVL